MLVAEREKRKERLIIRMRGELDGSSVIQLSTLLGEAANSHIAHLTLDFSQILRFEYTGIALSVAVFEFYAEDFSEITCCGLPQGISKVFKGLGIQKIPGLKIVPIDDGPEGVAVSNL